MSALDVFTYSGIQVRTVTIDGDPWFVAADVARILGYRMASDMTRRLDDDEKGTHSLRTPGGEQAATVINEPGLYVAIIGSQVHEAKAFKRWITHEVLPQIRRTGQYGAALPTSFAEALELAAAEARRVEHLEAQALEAAPKVEAFEALMESDGTYTMEAAAKVLGMGRNTFFRRLRELGIIQPGSRLPYQRHMHHFDVTATTWTDNEGLEHPSFRVHLTPAGLEYVRKRLHASTDVEALS
jgi:prophage antirepressor-like protein